MLLLYTAFLLPLAVVPAAVFTRRQVLPVGASSDALEPLLTTLFGYDDPPILTPNKSWALKPRFRLDAKRKVVRWGPFELPAALKPNETVEYVPYIQSMDPLGTVFVATLKDGICQNCTVLAGKVDLEFEDGRPADISGGVYLHHVLTVDRSKPAPNFVPFCLSGADDTEEMPNPMGMLFLGGGSDASGATYATPDKNIQSGYHIKNNTFAMTADIVNYNTKNTTIYVTYDLEYVPGKLGGDASSTLISVTGCMGAGFRDDESVANHTSPNFPMREDGWIINARGHLHDGGESMLLYLNDKLVCNSTATYGGPRGTVKVNGIDWKTISDMSECRNPLKVKKGDRLRMQSFYNTDKHPLRESGGEKMEEMGMFTITFVPSSEMRRP